MNELNRRYDFVIVGAGAGGSTIAKELSKENDRILVLEKGHLESNYGTFMNQARFFDTNMFYFPKKSKEGIIIWRTLMAGGAAFVSTGNMVRCLEDEFKTLGIDLSDEFVEAEKELQVAPLSDKLISKGTKAIVKAANELGYSMEPMMKAINPQKCIRCGKCTMGCQTEAKWTPLVYLNEALDNGVDIMYETSVKKIISDNGRVTGVIAHSSNRDMLIKANCVILSAGGMGTPVILQASGINNAGSHLFIDILKNVYGVHKTINIYHEPQMSVLCSQFHKTKGFIISPYVNQHRAIRFLEAGMKGFMMPDQNILGLMVKTTDEANGEVFADGSVSKSINKCDEKKLAEGVDIAKEILEKVGVNPKSFVVTKPQGAHPGGTAAIGEVVDTNMETEIENLFVCDASIFPVAPGAPPILTIIALSKRLGKIILSKTIQ
jgi:choline dehydrogenase-like flavoprotein